MTETERVSNETAASTGDEYDAHYYATQCGQPYERNEHWLRFFAGIADRIVADIAPRSVLDAGCAMGFLVESLRDRGVEAWGVDISEYALSQVREDMKPYVRRASLTEPLTEHYDLIVSIEVLEHLPHADAEAAVANLCAHTDDIIFSSTATDYAEASHVNVQPAEYWAELFARQRFFRDVDYVPSYITAWAARFRRREQPVHLLVKDYERAFARLQAASEGRRQALAERDVLLADREARLEAALAEQRRLEEEQQSLRKEALRLAADLSQTQNLLVEMEGRVRALTIERDALRAAQDTLTFRLGESLRHRAHGIAPPGTRRGRAAHRAFRAATVFTEDGAGEVARRAARKLRNRNQPAPALVAQQLPPDPTDEQYQSWLQRHDPDELTLGRMREESEAWPVRPLVSIVMPVYNTRLDWLYDAIESVRAQSYTNWELCIADDASSHGEVRTALQRYAAEDPRIKAMFREQNGGIAAASNNALALAEGAYVALLDHDDVLAPHALHRMVAHVLEHPEDGLVYSDEDKLRPDGRRGFPFFKPDWSPDLLLSVNYVCHFTMIRRDLVTAAGGFHPGFDGSQDYDLILRVIDLGTPVGHVADVLYSWRMVQGSTALEGSAKPLAYEAGRRAIQASMDRRGISARVDEARVPGRYEVRRRISGRPTVALVIPTRDRVDLLQTCIESIESRSTYRNYRIVIIDNDSRDEATIEYLARCGHQVVPHPGPFNYSRIINAGVAAASGDHIVLLNNDIEVIEPGWIEAMLEHSQRPEVGAVGARLLYGDGSPQHEGIAIGTGFIAGNLNHGNYFALGLTTQDKTAVTGACMMFRREVFHEVGGFDEGLSVAFNDVDFCLRVRQHGYWIVYTPLAELYHHESASRGRLHPMDDERFFIERWGTHDTLCDPFVNANVLHVNPFRLRP